MTKNDKTFSLSPRMHFERTSKMFLSGQVTDPRIADLLTEVEGILELEQIVPEMSDSEKISIKNEVDRFIERNPSEWCDHRTVSDLENVINQLRSQFLRTYIISQRKVSK